MKKSKLLMPLTGIAAIGAIAPVAVMTACHKNEYKLIASNKCGNVIDANTELMTNRLGFESLMDSSTTEAKPVALEKASVSFAARLVKPYKEFTRGHVVKVSASLKGETGPTGTPFIIEEFKDEKIVVDETKISDDLVWEDKIDVKINTEKMVELYKTKDEEEFKFTLVYEEFDSEKTDAKSVGKQSVEYSLVACPTKHDVCKLDTTTPMVLAGNIKSTTEAKNVNLGGVDYATGLWSDFLSEDARQDLAITIKTDKIVLTENKESEPRTLTIDPAGQTLNVAKDADVPEEYIKGSVSKTVETTETTGVAFYPEEDTYIVFEVKTTAANEEYVVGSWTLSYSLELDDGITVYPAA